MKISMNWLREWIQPPADARAVAARLTMAGIEADVEPLPSGALGHVVVGRIASVQPHPQADRLRICEVDVNRLDQVSIVCGAPNARAGEMAVVALPGAVLPGGVTIEATAIRGVASAGMLCSARELGLAEKSEGLLYLDRDAVPGTPLAEHLRLADELLTIEFTPNRGDCISVAGLARELGALYDLRPQIPPARAVVAAFHDQVRVEIDDAAGCSSYAGRIVRDVSPNARTPDWMREKLRRSGVRGIHPVVDITNYVMLELGQPMHAFDLAKLTGAVRVRRAKSGEKLALLSEQTVALHEADLLIADDRGPLALAGVMGGMESGVTDRTTSVFLESACFSTTAVAGAGRRHRLQSDALYRFERGVDPELQARALERATQLVLEICGGQPGPVTHVGQARTEPVWIPLRRSRLVALLGHDIPASDVEKLLGSLGIVLNRATADEWRAHVPSYRYDLRIEADLIEEVARLYGYERIPAKPYRAQLATGPVPESLRSLMHLRRTLVARGYQEVITYSFVNPRIDATLAPGAGAIALDNPIAETMGVMRTTLWSGLIPAWLHNAQRQQRRARLFEVGVCFAEVDGQIQETLRIGGLVAGSALPEQWGAATTPADFYDVKADVEALLAGGNPSFEAAEQPALHPGRSARVGYDGRMAGWIGALSPRVVRELDLPEAPLVFELSWPVIREQRLPAHAAVPELPSSRRDQAYVVRDDVTAGQLIACARGAGGERLREIRVFDVYRGAGLPKGCKSIALGLIFQDYSRTLTDEEVDAAVQAVASRLAQELGASIRS